MRIIVFIMSFIVTLPCFAISEQEYAKELVSKIYLGGKVYSQEEFDEFAPSFQVEQDLINLEENLPIYRRKNFRRAVNASLAASIILILAKGAKDKKYHGGAGLLSGIGATGLCSYLIEDDEGIVCALTGAAVSLIFALGKELYDSTGRGNVDAMDAFATFVPGLLVSFSIDLY